MSTCLPVVNLMGSKYREPPKNVTTLKRDKKTEERLAERALEEQIERVRKNIRNEWPGMAVAKAKELGPAKAKKLAIEGMNEFIKSLKIDKAMMLYGEFERAFGLTKKEAREGTFESIVGLIEEAGTKSMSKIYAASAAWRGLEFTTDNIGSRRKARFEKALLTVVRGYLESGNTPEEGNVSIAAAARKAFPTHIDGLEQLLYEYLDKLRKVGTYEARRAELVVYSTFDLDKEKYKAYREKKQLSLHA